MSVLVDWDPHGLGIAAVYRSGSIAQTYSPLRLAAGARLGWLGVRGLADGEIDREATMPLTDADRRTAFGLLNRGSLAEEWRYVWGWSGVHGLEPGFDSETVSCSEALQFMLHVGRKAETEAVLRVADYVKARL
jgi:DNA topoisomerase VI subunit A